MSQEFILNVHFYNLENIPIDDNIDVVNFYHSLQSWFMFSQFSCAVRDYN